MLGTAFLAATLVLQSRGSTAKRASKSFSEAAVVMAPRKLFNLLGEASFSAFWSRGDVDVACQEESHQTLS